MRKVSRGIRSKHKRPRTAGQNSTSQNSGLRSTEPKSKLKVKAEGWAGRNTQGWKIKMGGLGCSRAIRKAIL